MNAGTGSAEACADSTSIVGIMVPSTSPVFVGLVAAHVSFALAALACGAVAMFSPKGRGRHPEFGLIYFQALLAACALAMVLSAMRWRQDYPLAILGGLASAAAGLGRTARQGRWGAWIPIHIGGMSASYVLMVTAFYVDNGKSLPFWKALPPATYWLLPTLVGAPIAGLSIWRRRRRAVEAKRG